MTEYKSSLLRLLDERGYVHQATDPAGLDALASREVVPGYIGFDATAPSLHVGSLVQIMMLRRLQQAGHKPIVLMGGGTTKIGDPSGKDESRRLLSHEEIQANIASIRKVFEHFLTFGDGPTDAIMVDNADWLDRLAYIDLLRTVGPHFTVNRMLTFDSVSLRLEREQPLTFLEFNYMILQAYDFRELSLRHGCRLQLGGSDQWGNIVNGMELARRMDGAELYGVTTPLITTADGAKMGKTASGAVWLNADQLPAYDYWQFWRNTADDDVVKFLKLFTDLSLKRIGELAKLEGQAINEAKIVLANEATAMLHGRASTEAAAESAKVAFAAAKGEAAGFGTASATAVPIFVTNGREVPVVDALVGLQFVASRGEAKRKIVEGAVKIDNKVVTDPMAVVPLVGEVPISLGKKKHGLLKSA
jgi:tyrosyl-tRNA synthetase